MIHIPFDRDLNEFITIENSLLFSKYFLHNKKNFNKYLDEKSEIWLLEKLIENIIPYIIVFTASIYRPYDSDLGWHLEYGEYFFKNGHILKDNIFSTMMTDYKWANLSWATDILTYIVFNNFSFFGLTKNSLLEIYFGFPGA